MILCATTMQAGNTYSIGPIIFTWYYLTIVLFTNSRVGQLPDSLPMGHGEVPDPSEPSQYRRYHLQAGVAD